MGRRTTRKVVSSAVGLDYLVSCLPEKLQTLEYEEEIFAAAGERIVELESQVEALQIQLKANVDGRKADIRQAYFEKGLNPDSFGH